LGTPPEVGSPREATCGREPLSAPEVPTARRFASAGVLGATIAVACSAQTFDVLEPPPPHDDAGLADEPITSLADSSSAASLCLPIGEGCSYAGACCSLACRVAGADGSLQCVAGPECAVAGAACSVATDCCGGRCMGGMCAPSPPPCHPAGESCGPMGGCCSGACAAQRCVLLGACRPIGELCAADSDCCSASCKLDPDHVGRCAALPMCTTNDGKPCAAQVGDLCDMPGDCCTRVCETTADGVKHCLSAGGCSATCEVCSSNAQCCSGRCAAGAGPAGGPDAVPRCQPTGD